MLIRGSSPLSLRCQVRPRESSGIRGFTQRALWVQAGWRGAVFRPRVAWVVLRHSPGAGHSARGRDSPPFQSGWWGLSTAASDYRGGAERQMDLRPLQPDGSRRWKDLACSTFLVLSVINLRTLFWGKKNTSAARAKVETCPPPRLLQCAHVPACPWSSVGACSAGWLCTLLLHLEHTFHVATSVSACLVKCGIVSYGTGTASFLTVPVAMGRQVLSGPVVYKLFFKGVLGFVRGAPGGGREGRKPSDPQVALTRATSVWLHIYWAATKLWLVISILGLSIFLKPVI